MASSLIDTPCQKAKFRALCLLVSALAALVAVLLPCQASGAALKRLEIDVVGFAGDGNLSVPLIWGHIGDDAVYIGGDRVPRDRAPASSLLAPEETVEETVQEEALPQPKVAPQPEASPLLTSRFELKAKEHKDCTASLRFRMLSELLQSLRERVAAVVWQADPAWTECAEQATRSLAKMGITLSRSESKDSLDHAVIIVQFTGKSSENRAASAPPIELKRSPAQTKKKAATLAKTAARELRIDGELMPITSSGWFVFQSKDFSKHEIFINEYGFIEWHHDVQSWPVKIGESAGPSSVGIASLLVTGGMSKLQIRAVDLPPSAQSLVFDLASGGGFGYGHHLPNETRGSRLALAGAIQQREIDFGIGGRISGAYTNSSTSALTNTLLVDGTLTKTRAFRGGSWQGRLGAGMRFFESTQKTLKEAAPLLIPQSVLGPLFTLAMDGKVRDVLLGAGIAYVPLYVLGSGLTQTWSPNLSLGYSLGQGSAVLLTLSEDTVKYPTLTGNASLTLDTLYLSFRLGL